MPLSHLNPFVRYARLHLHYSRPKEDSLCYDCRLFYILRGEGFLSANEKKFEFLQGTAVFLPPATRYRFDFEDDTSVKIYVFDFDLTDDYSTISHSVGTATVSNFDPTRVLHSKISSAFDEVWVGAGSIFLQNELASCVDLFLSQTADYQHFASARLKLALLDLMRESQNERADYRLVASVQDYVRRQYCDASLTNQKIGEEFSYHPYHISRLMKQYTKKTLHEYILDYRLQMAKNDLITTQMSITEIADRSGFASYTYFIKIFREREGISPLKYRKRHTIRGF